ncbi:hypothetical protein VTI28DRAFT_4560 [Corynascus sepedonium]
MGCHSSTTPKFDYASEKSSSKCSMDRQGLSLGPWFAEEHLNNGLPPPLNTHTQFNIRTDPYIHKAGPGSKREAKCRFLAALSVLRLRSLPHIESFQADVLSFSPPASLRLALAALPLTCVRVVHPRPQDHLNPPPTHGTVPGQPAAATVGEMRAPTLFSKERVPRLRHVMRSTRQPGCRDGQVPNTCQPSGASAVVGGPALYA